MSRSASMSILTIAGLLDYDDTLFDYMAVPEDVDKETVIAYILMATQELEILFPSAPVMKKTIHYWSIAESPIWSKMLDIQELEYNPLENYDVYDERHEAFNRGDSSNSQSQTNEQRRVDDDTISGSQKSSTDNSSGSSNSSHSVAAYNASTPQLANSDSESHTDGDIASETVNGSDNRDITESSQNNRSGSSSSTRNEYDNSNGHTHGNMGSYSYQELIKSEREIRESHIYEYIAQSFKRRFCLLVY